MSLYSTYFGTISVKDPTYGAKGDGTTDDTAAIQAAFNAAFGTSASPNGSSGQYNNKAVYFPPGKYIVNSSSGTAALTLTSVQGGIIFGGGLQDVQIRNNTSGGIVLATNGCAYTRFSDLSFSSAGTSSIAFNLDWDGTGSVALNANYFENVAFSAEIGIQIGVSGNMGSENLFVGCAWTNCTSRGMNVANFNALDQTIIGGSSSGNATGFYVQSGSIPLLSDVGLAGNTVFDIDIQSNSVFTALGCRSESSNFINAPAGTISIISCDHTGNGTFVSSLNGACFISGSQTSRGTITGNHGVLDVNASSLGTRSLSVTGAVNNGSGLIRLTINPVAPFITGDLIDVASVGGVPNATGTWTMTAIDSTHIDLQGSTFAGSYTSGGSVATNALNYIKGYSGAISADADRSVRLTKTANFTIPRGLSGYQFDNLGAGGEVDFTLPTLADTDAFVLGTKFGFYVGAAQTLKVIATNSMTIRNVGTVSGSNGNIASSTIGCYVEIEAVSTSQWVVKSINGTWTVT